MAANNSLESQLGALSPRIALAPLLALALVGLAVPGLRDLLWYLAAIAPVTAVATWLIGRRMGRHLDRTRPAHQPTTDGPARTDEMAATTGPSRDGRKDGRARALDEGRRAAEQSLRASRLVRELARTSLRIGADAQAARAHLPNGSSDGSSVDQTGAARARLDAIARESVHLYWQVQALAPDIRCRQATDIEAHGDVGQAIDLALALLADRLTRLNISAVVHRPDGPLECAGDIRALQSIFAQLIDNAAAAVAEQSAGVVAASAPDSVQEQSITVTLSRSPGDAAVLIDIVDTGVGLPVVDRARLFDPDFSTRGAGRGAGLAVCRHALARIGGYIEMAPAASGRGTHARVAVPTKAFWTTGAIGSATS